MSLGSEGTIVLLLVYIIASVSAGAIIGRRIGYTICTRGEITDGSRRFMFIMIFSIILGGAVGPLVGIGCLLSSGPG